MRDDTPMGTGTPKRPRRMPGRRRALALLAALLLPLAACGGAGEAGDEPGQAAPETTALPAAAGATVPSWLPLYPGGQVEPVYTQKTGEGIVGAVVLYTEDDPREVARFYKEQLEARDFELRITPYRSDFGRGARIAGHTRSETQGITATVNPEEERTQVWINFTYVD